MDSPRSQSSAAPALLGMVGAWVGVFAGAAVTAEVWKYPLLMVGNEGGSPGAALGALLTVLFWLVLASMGLGLVVVGGIGAGLGWLVRGRGHRWALGAGVAAGVVLAVAAGVIAVLVG